MKPLFSARAHETRNEARSYVDDPETLDEIDAEIERLRIVSGILKEYDRSLIDTLVCRHYPHGQTPPASPSTGGYIADLNQRPDRSRPVARPVLSSRTARADENPFSPTRVTAQRNNPK